MNNQEKLSVKQLFKVQKYSPGIVESCEVEVATEVPFTINVNDVEVATLFCTPDNLKELVYGFLFTQGMIASADEIKKVYIERETWKAIVETVNTPDMNLLGKRIFTAGCGKGIMYSGVMDIMSRDPLPMGFTVSAEAITSCMREVATSSSLHKTTGGVHTATLSFSGEKPVVSIDDIGRHNAVDKVIGEAICTAIDLSKCVLLSTGRISSEILFKAKKAQIPVIASMGSPTHQSLLLARKLGITLCGFVRGEKFTLFSNSERITL